MDKKDKQSKTAFLVTPIGSSDSPVRRRVDQWEEMIYIPALGDEYKVVRADKIHSPGIITEQIIQHIIDADLVVIDYTGLNPNVMYEAAIRHLAEKPYIQIYEKGIPFPFDIQNLRAIGYDSSDLKYPEQLIEDIQNSLKAITSSDYRHPQIVKEKFDFNKIVSDPEKFVDLLKEHIIPKTTEKFTSSEDSIVTVSNSNPYEGATFGGQKKIVCPKCKTIKYSNGMSVIGGDAYYSVEATASVFGGYGGYHYKCNNCGTEFEA